MKKTLIHLNTSPYSNLSCKEGLDLALVLATFEQAVDISISGAALSILLKNQEPSQEHGKHLHKLLDGLEFYDIENVFIKADQQLKNTSYWEGAQPLSDTEWFALFSQYDHIFRF